VSNGDACGEGSWGAANTANRKYHASFGGLLLYMEGPYKKLNGLKIDTVYMLVKRA
jgi:hypothetical protein